MANYPQLDDLVGVWKLKDVNDALMGGYWRVSNGNSGLFGGGQSPSYTFVYGQPTNASGPRVAGYELSAEL